MRLIDFDRQGNVVRYYLGHDGIEEWYGDDWDDRPYECNAGTVYEDYVCGYVDIAYDMSHRVLEPCDGEYNSPWCKDDMKARRVPMLVVTGEDKDAYGSLSFPWDFKSAVCEQSSRKIYMGDNYANGDSLGGTILKTEVQSNDCY